MADTHDNDVLHVGPIDLSMTIRDRYDFIDTYSACVEALDRDRLHALHETVQQVLSLSPMTPVEEAAFQNNMNARELIPPLRDYYTRKALLCSMNAFSRMLFVEEFLPNN